MKELCIDVIVKYYKSTTKCGSCFWSAALTPGWCSVGPPELNIIAVLRKWRVKPGAGGGGHFGSQEGWPSLEVVLGSLGKPEASTPTTVVVGEGALTLVDKSESGEETRADSG